MRLGCFAESNPNNEIDLLFGFEDFKVHCYEIILKDEKLNVSVGFYLTDMDCDNRNIGKMYAEIFVRQNCLNDYRIHFCM